MRARHVSALCVTTLLAGCCISPTEEAIPDAALVAAPPTEAAPPVEPQVPPPDAASAAAAAEPLASAAPEAPAAPAAAPPPVSPPTPAGATYSFPDVGISVQVPEGWTQQLMTGGVVALFSGDYPRSGARDHGALILISRQPGGLPADDAALEAVLAEGLDPAAVKQAGPIRFPVGDRQAGQIISKVTEDDGTTYQAMHTILQSGGSAVSMKSLAYDSLNNRKATFDRVMESITFTGG